MEITERISDVNRG